MYDVVQAPDDNIQEGGVNVPPEFPSIQVIVPVGVFVALVVSATVAVNVT